MQEMSPIDQYIAPRYIEQSVAGWWDGHHTFYHRQDTDIEKTERFEFAMMTKNDDEPPDEPSIDEGLQSVRAFKNIENAADRQRVIELAKQLSANA
jgi:hypothetical protein